MARSAITELYAAGFTKEDVKMALATQAAQRKSGARVMSLDVICGHTPLPRRRSAGPRPVGSLADVEAAISKGRRYRGKYAEAGLLLERMAADETCPERAAQTKAMSVSVRGLEPDVKQQYDFFWRREYVYQSPIF